MVIPANIELYNHTRTTKAENTYCIFERFGLQLVSCHIYWNAVKNYKLQNLQVKIANVFNLDNCLRYLFFS